MVTVSCWHSRNHSLATQQKQPPMDNLISLSIYALNVCMIYYLETLLDIKDCLSHVQRSRLLLLTNIFRQLGGSNK